MGRTQDPLGSATCATRTLEVRKYGGSGWRGGSAPLLAQRQEGDPASSRPPVLAGSRQRDGKTFRLMAEKETATSGEPQALGGKPWCGQSICPTACPSAAQPAGDGAPKARPGPGALWKRVLGQLPRRKESMVVVTNNCVPAGK